MENGHQRSLAHYYRQLQAVEKTFSNAKTRNTNKAKTFLKYKSQTPLHLPKSKLQDLQISPYRHTKLSLNTKKKLSEIPNQQLQEDDGLPIKYLAELNESLISKNGMNNSTATKEENQKIILEIQQPVSKFDYSEDRQINKDERKTILAHFRPKSENKQEFRFKNSQGFLSKQCKQLIENLAKRNRVYEKIKARCRSKQGQQVADFQTIWKKCQLYNKLILKLNNLACNIK